MASIINIAREIRSALSFLYLSDDIIAFARGIGYDLEPVDDELSNVETVVSELISKLDDLSHATDTLINLDDPFGNDASVAATEFAKVVGSIYTVYEKIKAIGNSFTGSTLTTYLSEIMGGGSNPPEQFVLELLERSVGLLVNEHLSHERPEVKEFLEIIGVLENTEQPAEPAQHRIAFTEHRINWNAFSEFLRNPTNYIQQLYQWGAGVVGLNRLLDRLQWLAISKMIPASVVYATQQELAEFENIVDGTYPAVTGDARLLRVLLWEDEASGFRLEIQLAVIPPTTSVPNPGVGFALVATLSGSQEIYLTENLVLTINGGMDLQAGIYLAFMPGKTPGFSVQLPDVNLSSTSITIAKRTRTGAPPHVLLGSLDGNRLEIGGIDGAVGIEIVSGEPPDLYGEIQLNDGRIVVNTADADGFIKKVLPENLNIDSSFDIIIGWSTEKGIYFRGSGGIDITIPIHQTLGPIKIDTLYLSLDLTEQGDIDAGIALTAGIELGPIGATIDRIGTKIGHGFPPGGGNKGPLHQNIRFKPPIGAGLAINAGGIVGGGFLEFDDPNKRYAGVLALNFGEIGLTAIGLITTRMPDGSEGFALLINIGVTFDPPFQLSFGFTLSGVGGLIGVNRTMEIDVLRTGIKNRTLDSILFPDPNTVIANASKIISDLRAVFPPSEGRFVVGPMVKIGWGSPNIITADIGIFIELPDPVRIVFMGQLTAAFPEEKNGIVIIHLDILGVLDFAKEELTFQASLYDSRVLAFTMFGDSAFLLGWGNDPRFALSLGGFHPKFTPPPPPVVFANLKRLTICISSGSNLQLSCRAYQALTPNSLQFGARVDLYASAAGATVKGYLGFDALFIFSPFSFEVWMGAGVQLKYQGISLLEIELAFLLAGPTPWLARGKAKIKILFVSIKVSFKITWGEKKKATLPAVDPWEPFKGALGAAGNWGSVLPEGRTVVESLRGFEEGAGEQIVVHPGGRFEVRQNVVPMGVGLDTAGNAPISGHDLFDIEDLSVNGDSLDLKPVEEFFARGQFEELSNQQKLSVPSFEKMKGGVTTAASEAVKIEGTIEDKALAYESILIKPDRTSQRQQSVGVLEWEEAKFIARANIGKRAMRRAGPKKRFSSLRPHPKVAVFEERYCIAEAEDLTRADLSSQLNQENSGLSRMAADQVLKAQLELEPDQTGKLVVIPEYEALEEAA